jgi:hypothetical protein
MTITPRMDVTSVLSFNLKFEFGKFAALSGKQSHQPIPSQNHGLVSGWLLFDDALPHDQIGGSVQAQETFSVKPHTYLILQQLLKMVSSITQVHFTPTNSLTLHIQCTL